MPCKHSRQSRTRAVQVSTWWSLASSHNVEQLASKSTAGSALKQCCTLSHISPVYCRSHSWYGAGPSQQELAAEADQAESSSPQDSRDADAEAELAAVVKDDPLAAYDVDVRQEGMAIHEYLRMLQQQAMD